MISKPYFPNLDASRFFAFILVFLAHCFITTSNEIRDSETFIFIERFGKLGYLGLEYFFVLSSFLITYLILEERQKTSGFHVKHFLIRRCLRVWPLYFLVVAAGYLVSGVATNVFSIAVETIPELHYFLLFIINFYAIEHGTDFLFFLAFLWSISIEEQFYLAWAFVMKAYRKKLFPILCLSLALVSIAFRFYYMDDSRRLYFHTVSTLGNFAVGAYFAYAAFYRNQFYRFIKNISKRTIVLFYIVLVTSIFSYHLLREFEFFIGVQRLYYSLFFGVFIMEQAFAKQRFFNPGNIPAFNYLGKISYGLYCYHGIVITILIKVLEVVEFEQNYWHLFGVFPLIIFTFTALFSTLSYRYFERYFLSIKRRFDRLTETG